VGGAMNAQVPETPALAEVMCPENMPDVPGSITARRRAE